MPPIRVQETRGPNPTQVSKTPAKRLLLQNRERSDRTQLSQHLNGAIPANARFQSSEIRTFYAVAAFPVL